MVGMISGLIMLCLMSFWGFILVNAWVMGQGLEMFWGIFGVNGENLGLGFGSQSEGSVMVFSVVFVGILVFCFSSYYMSSICGLGGFNLLVLVFVLGVLVMLSASSGYSLLIGWEILGVVSFLLIGFYGSRSSWGSALVTVLMNRVGDVGLVLLLWVLYKSQFWGPWGVVASFTAVFVGLCLVTKSAQFPFGGWLPMAMAAPTPVSAFVHSSTLVIAGLYVAWVMESAFDSKVWAVLGILGLCTLLSAGFSAVSDADIKKVVAYSTSLHLGLMVVIFVFVGGLLMGFHMNVHAYFKSILFIGVGMVILAIFHDQDFRGFGVGLKYGGLMSILCMSSMYSLVGLTYFSGWVTKDGFLELSTSEFLGALVWLLLMWALGSSGAYSIKLLSSVVKDSAMLNLVIMEMGSSMLYFSMTLVLGVVVSIIAGSVIGFWVSFGGGELIISGLEKSLYVLILVVWLALWIRSGSMGLGSSVNFYLQSGVQVLLVSGACKGMSVLWSIVEGVWLEGLFKSGMTLVESWQVWLTGILVYLDWLFVVLVVSVGAGLGIFMIC
uniref:NADH:ubiquinone reductase (H(+)-translocating) n=1 Tax=Plagiorhynchus transversus TaxID=1795586 RepID=A0A140E9N0_9BILA|nr:NADH dehydrogenase subunit 5 [Plagiorhynchus transversus]AMK97081.1 NADH dehydrogenase subunit 5 [Plagiorhynchus transversus]